MRDADERGKDNQEQNEGVFKKKNVIATQIRRRRWGHINYTLEHFRYDVNKRDLCINLNSYNAAPSLLVGLSTNNINIPMAPRIADIRKAT